MYAVRVKGDLCPLGDDSAVQVVSLTARFLLEFDRVTT